MNRPRLLDLGCRKGGATYGYQLAGFHVTGVDNTPQPGYCGDEFHQADMLTFPLDGFDAIHASPPCQHHANVTRWRGDQDTHPDVLTPMLARLATITTPWVVENVPEALPTWDLVLCGTNFGLPVKRHRGFRFGNWSGLTLIAPCQCWRNPAVLPFMHKGERAYADAMGCTWMTKEDARQAVPPAYTEHIGRMLLDHLAAPKVPVPPWNPAPGVAPAVDTSPFCLPPDAECPDCESPAGMWCFAWCPRYAEDPDNAFDDAQAGDHPDGL